MINSTTEIRQAFLNFFCKNGHQIVASSSLVPKNDSTLLFTNSGMNQFKDVFLGLEKPAYSNVTTSQRCVRAGGKHNDLENVGYTSRHHTFFEMLGNFSFGDYFKHYAIQYAWELLTSKNWFNLLKERLWITVYETDDESYEIWRKEIGVPCERIVRIGDNKGMPYASDNFWQMGDTGPCGPCTEIFYDHGNHILGEPPGSNKGENDRYVEIWNIVFMQFNRQKNGIMEPLSKPSVDTGMGLERIAAVLQHVHSNYDIDLFRNLICSIAKITNTYDLNNQSLRVIADHIRSCAFLIADGVVPSNENRGYVLRHIMRRAIHHGNMLGVKETFFYKLIEPLIEVMGIAGNELKRQQIYIEKLLKNEEEQFSYTLERGLTLLTKELKKLSGNILSGEIAFRLYDTYGFPIDLTNDVCRNYNIKVDQAGFINAMKEQRYRSRKFSKFMTNYSIIPYISNTSEFYGYDYLTLHCNVVGLFVDGRSVSSINNDQEIIVILDKTPFYPESGGQVGDQGELKGNNFKFEVNDTKKYGQVIAHIGKLIFGIIRVDDIVQANVYEARRTCISLNHSATHLMHAALRQILGIHVTQKGSMVNDRILRFDFSHLEAMKLSEIRAVENLVNTQIRRNLLINTKMMNIETAKKNGAIALFNDRYDKYVRVLSIGDFSIELCTGTHVLRTGDIGLFHIISECSNAAGIRRIEAVTGKNAIANLHEQNDLLCNVMKLLKCNKKDLNKKVCNIVQNVHHLKKELKKIKEQEIAQKNANIAKKAVEIKGVKLLITELADIKFKIMRSLANELKNKLGSSIIVLATSVKNKISLIIVISDDVTAYVQADELINMFVRQVGGRGGGSANIAQANDIDTATLPIIFTNITNWLNARL